MNLPSFTAGQKGLLSPSDPSPVEVVNAQGSSPYLFVCEHAGRCVPKAIDLGLSCDALASHIGWDIGAAALTHLLARRLDAPAILQRYSRLVIDCNRPPDASDAMPELSDGIAVPGNKALSVEARAARAQDIFRPFDASVTQMLASGRRRAVFSIHSFNPKLSDGMARPWQLSFLFRRDQRTSQRLRELALERRHDLVIGMNEPYSIDDEHDWFVPRQGEPSGLPHSLIELRNDLIADASGQEEWAELLAQVLDRFCEEL